MAGFTKAERHRHYLSVVASILGMAVVVAPVSWYLVRPILVSSVSTAMAEDLKEDLDQRDAALSAQMDTKIGPLVMGFEAIIVQNINSIRRSITSMEFRQQSDPSSWTAQDAQNLTQHRINLEGQQQALAALSQ